MRGVCIMLMPASARRYYYSRFRSQCWQVQEEAQTTKRVM